MVRERQTALHAKRRSKERGGGQLHSERVIKGTVTRCFCFTPSGRQGRTDEGRSAARARPPLGLLGLFGVMSFPRKESQVPRDTGHPASVAALPLADRRSPAGQVLCLPRRLLTVWSAEISPLPCSLSGRKGRGGAFFTGRCFRYQCPCPARGGRARLCCLSLRAGQGRRCEAALTPSNWRPSLFWRQ